MIAFVTCPDLGIFRRIGKVHEGFRNPIGRVIGDLVEIYCDYLEHRLHTIIVALAILVFRALVVTDGILKSILDSDSLEERETVHRVRIFTGVNYPPPKGSEL